MPIPSFTGKSSLGSQIVYIQDGNIFTDDQPDDSIPISIDTINAQTRKVLSAGDEIEYMHDSGEIDLELQRYLDEKT